MALSQTFLEWKEATRQEGLQEGLQEGQREIFVNLLKVRFGKLDDALMRVVDAVLKLPSTESTRLLLESSREELTARFG